jgi:3-phosphoshikimate 1-carboxyvinyltransferase
MKYPASVEIPPLAGAPQATIAVPGSKSITNRALVLAALTGGCELHGVLASEDTEVMTDCLDRLGFSVRANWEEAWVLLESPRVRRSRIPISAAELFVANSGTTMRFVTAMLALGRGRFRLDGVPRMRQRPIQDLLDALDQLGVRARSENSNGCPPVVIDADGLPGGEVTVRGDVSSQFLSGLLMAAPFAERDLTIRVQGTLVSVPYVAMTTAMMRQFGLEVRSSDPAQYFIPAPQNGGIARYDVEPDASAASYFFAAAAITGGVVTVPGLTRASLQGDIRFVELLERMGCVVAYGERGITVTGRPLTGIDADMNDISDTAMTLAAVACFAEGPTTIRNVGHIRHKETDRLAALAQELRRIGAIVEEARDALTITPAPLRGAAIETYDDHRMAMSLALVGLRTPGISIQNPGCVAKTYPHFFDDLKLLRGL